MYTEDCCVFRPAALGDGGHATCWAIGMMQRVERFRLRQLRLVSRATLLAWCLLRPSVRLAVCHKTVFYCSIETAARIKLFFDTQSSALYPTLCYEKIWVSQK